MRLLHYILFIFTSLIWATGFAQYYSITSYNHRNGLTTENTLCAFQNQDGYLWIGTDGDGIIQFDGNHFFHSNINNVSHNLHIVDGFADKSTIYVATQFHGLFTYSHGEYKPFYKQVLQIGEPLRLVKNNQNIVFFGSKGIQVISPKGVLLRHKTFQSDNLVNLRQLLSTPYGVIAFTSVGNYLIADDKISNLSSYINSKKNGELPWFGSFYKNKLTLFDKSGKARTEILLSVEGDILRKKRIPCAYNFTELGELELATSKQNNILLKFTKNTLYTVNAENEFKQVKTNQPLKIDRINHLYIDKNNDFWMNHTNGLTKLSLEPFTRVNYHAFYKQPTLSHIFYTQTGRFILSTYDGETTLVNGVSGSVLQKFELNTHCIAETPLGLLFGTNKGLMCLENDQLKPIQLGELCQEEIIFVFYDGKNIWYAPRAKGLVRFNLKTEKSTHYEKLFIEFPEHFYTAQLAKKGQLVYFGSNNGIFTYNPKKDKFIHHPDFLKTGSFCGSSVTDKYGTAWFTLDNGIVGITKSNKHVFFDDPKKLNSRLLYTLCADDYGNLILGSNKGLQFLKVNGKGEVLRSKTYNENNGFDGYETNLRACLKRDKTIYLGTIEGLYSINTQLLERFPIPEKPVILKNKRSFGSKKEGNSNKTFYTVRSILTKSNKVAYSYRLVGFSNKWSKPSTQSDIFLPELENGNYQLNVRATYNGVDYSAISSLPIIISNPIWKTKWFFAFFVVVIGLINLFYLYWSKTNLKPNLFDTSDISLETKIIPKIILFGAVVNLAILTVVETVGLFKFSLVWSNTGFSILFFSLYFLCRLYLNQGEKRNRILYLFYFALLGIMIQYYVLLYLSKVDPFPIMAIIVITSILPYTFSNIRIVILIALIQVFISVILLVFIEKTMFNQTVFVCAITVSGGLAVMITYLRNDSLEKLIFISGIVNQGNVLAIAFDQKGIINYSSANISRFFQTNNSFILGKSLSILNPFIVNAEIRNTSLVDEFVDGKILLTPMYNKKNELIWMEWSCKHFNNSVRVIMGQDVTEKLTISTNYESLVENAQDIIYKTDVNGNFVFLNEMASKMFGYRYENLNGEGALKLVPAEHRERVTSFYINQFINKIHHTYLEFPIRAKNGKVFWVGQNTTMTLEPGSRKRISGFTSVARDITEKRANELLIEQQNKDINSSINSAKRIQFNLLPKTTDFAEYFEQSFVLFRPKDIVSGDFYWLSKKDGKLIVALADCTGHGVPGAFMTILGINLLNQIVVERNVTEPDVILNLVSEELEKTLPKNEEGKFWDGMDLIVVVFDNDQISFASSGVGLVHSSEGLFNLHRSSIVSNRNKQHKKKSIPLKENDQIYLFTDGMQKQLGSIRTKKFGLKRILEILEKVHPESLSLQRKYFENALNNWSVDHAQTDDITIIGLKNFRDLIRNKKD